MAVEPDRGSEPPEQPAIGTEADVVAIVRRVAEPGRRDVADHDQRCPPEPGLDKPPRDPQHLAPGEPRAAAVARLVDPGPLQADDPDPGHALDPARREPARHEERPLLPATPAVVVAADIDEGGMEGVGQERQPLGLQIATAEDAIERTQVVAIDLVVERRLRVVGGGEEADRPAGATLERARIGPRDPQPPDHDPVFVGGRRIAARRSRLSSISDAKDSAGSRTVVAGSTRSTTSASIETCPR